MPFPDGKELYEPPRVTSFERWQLSGLRLFVWSWLRSYLPASSPRVRSLAWWNAGPGRNAGA